MWALVEIVSKKCAISASLVALKGIMNIHTTSSTHSLSANAETEQCWKYHRAVQEVKLQMAYFESLLIKPLV